MDDTIILNSIPDTLFTPNTVVIINQSSEIGNALLSGVISSALVASLFFLIKYWVKPKIKISNTIIKRRRLKKNNQSEYEEVFQVKIINETKYPIEELRISMYLCKTYYVGQNENVIYDELKLRDKYLDFMYGTRDKDNRLNDHCFLITLDCNIEEIWTDNSSYLEFQISSRHSVSGFKKTYIQRFKDINTCLKEGTFRSGETFEVIGSE